MKSISAFLKNVGCIYPILLYLKSKNIKHKYCQKLKYLLQICVLITYTLAVFDYLIVVPNFLITTQSYFAAFRLCKDIDEADTAYLALSIEFDLPLLTNDRILAEGLKRKGYTNVITLTELFDML